MSSRRVPPAALAAALVVLAAAPYARSLGHPLLFDDRTLVASPWIQKEVGIVSAFTTDYWHGTRHEGSYLYRPLTILSLAWNARFAGSREGFNGVNVALHAAVVLLAFAALRRLFGNDGTWGAFAGAAVFAVHPLASEAVLWSVGRAETLAAGFGLASLLLFFDRRSRAASAACFFLALLAKESAVTWALVLGAAWWGIGDRPRGWRDVARAAWPYAAALAVFLALRAAAVGTGGAVVTFVDNPLATVDPATRAANAVLVLLRYLGSALWPATLSVEYGFDQIRVVPLFPWGALAAVALVAAWIAAIAVAWRRGARAVALLVAWPVLAFAATSNVFFPIGTIVAERLAYTPLIGLSGAIGYGAMRARGRFGARPVVAAVLAIVVALGARTSVRASDYASLETLTEATAAASPRAVKALANLGRLRLRLGRPAEAVEALERAVAIWPGYARGLDLLAQAYAATGRSDLAAETAQRAREAAGRGPEPSDD